MIRDVSSYDDYLKRYRMFWSEEGDDRPPMLSREEYREKYGLLCECYRTYWELMQGGTGGQGGHLLHPRDQFPGKRAGPCGRIRQLPFG